VTAEAIGLLRFSFTSLKAWFDMRDLGAVIEHEGPLAPSCERSGAAELQDHQRGVAMGRRVETSHFAHAKFEGTARVALGLVALLRRP
jgi:hypothetical protein